MQCSRTDIMGKSEKKRFITRAGIRLTSRFGH